MKTKNNRTRRATCSPADADHLFGKSKATRERVKVVFPTVKSVVNVIAPL